jgi:hypothetical protein
VISRTRYNPICIELVESQNPLIQREREPTLIQLRKTFLGRSEGFDHLPGTIDDREGLGVNGNDLSVKSELLLLSTLFVLPDRTLLLVMGTTSSPTTREVIVLAGLGLRAVGQSDDAITFSVAARGLRTDPFRRDPVRRGRVPTGSREPRGIVHQDSRLEVRHLEFRVAFGLRLLGGQGEDILDSEPQDGGDKFGDKIGVCGEILTWVRGVLVCGHGPVRTSPEVEATEILASLWGSWTAEDEVRMVWPTDCLVDHDPSLFKIEMFVYEVNREVAIESI